MYFKTCVIFYNFKDRTKKGKKNGSFKDCNQKIENKQKS